MRRKYQFGLTTILLVVTAVGVLGSFCVVWQKSTSHRQAEQQLRYLAGIAASIGEFRRIKGRVPTEEEGLDALQPRSPAKWGMYYLYPGFSLDAWDNEIVYDVLGSKEESAFDLRSLGPNGIDDGGMQDDISLRHGYDLDYYDLAERRAALGYLFLGVLIFALCSATTKYVVRKQCRRTNDVAEPDTNCSEAIP